MQAIIFQPIVLSDSNSNRLKIPIFGMHQFNLGKYYILQDSEVAFYIIFIFFVLLEIEN